MKIDRHNYEEFFILYMDNELSAEESRLVEQFAEENADLKEELDLLMQSRMLPDEEIVFADRDSLLKTGGLSTININNYEEWLLSYTDNELTTQQKNEVEKFIANHSSLQNELTLLMRTRLEPETLVFPDKHLLYRKEEKVRIVAINWKRYAAAAALLLAVSTTAFFALRNNKNNNDGVAKLTPIKNIPAATDSNEIKQLPAENDAPVIADVNNDRKDAPVKRDAVANKEQKETPRKKTSPEVLPSPIKQNIEIAQVKPMQKPSNNLPEPKNNPYIKENKELDNVIAMADPSTKPSLTNTQQKSTIGTVTSEADPAFIQARNTDESVAVTQPGSKNKLRGFFRKLTRTFEKTTNIKATDDEDRLLVGGLAIRL
jgi:hypothetical protein